MDVQRIPMTFVRTVKPQDVSFRHVDSTLRDMRTKGNPSWVILTFAGRGEGRNTMKVAAYGKGSLSDKSKWPSELFSSTGLCYGLCRFDFDVEGIPPTYVSFCWKGRNLPIFLRTKYTEFNHTIRKHLGAASHVNVQKPDDIMDNHLLEQMPHRPRSWSRRFITSEVEFAPGVESAIQEIRSDDSPFNWVVCGYDTANQDRSQLLIVLDKGMTGLYALKGLGGIIRILQDGCTMYVYLRVDVPLHRRTGQIVSKYVLVTWQGNGDESNDYMSDDDIDFWNGPPSCRSNDGSSTPKSFRDSFGSNSSSKVQRAITTHIHGSEIYRVFPHHVHFFASSLSEITEEAVRDRVRRAVDSDCMLVRAVCIQASGDVQPAVCIEVSYDATVANLRKEIALHIGVPEERQRIVWIRQIEEFENGVFQQGSKATWLDDDEAELRQDVGLSHGDKIHIDDTANGDDSVLVNLVKQVKIGANVMSLSAERRHEVQRGVKAREAELKKILSVTQFLIRRKTHKELVRSPSALSEGPTSPRFPPPAPVSQPSSRRIAPAPSLSHSLSSKLEEEKAPEQNWADAGPASNASTENSRRRTASVGAPTDLSEQDLGQDVSSLQEQARVLEIQNKYLEIPYESIRILGGRANELGCGKAATVYRGFWMSSSGTAEVAVKLFRYVRLTDKILTDYTQEVALLRKLKHPNIVLFIGACTKPKLIILTEYCSRKSLYEVIHSNNFETIPWKYKVRMMLDAARGIQYLHSKRIIHRDIKSHNFLVDDDWRVKVADFGISKVLDQDSTAFTQCGTTGWVAPEVLVDEDLGYTFKADNWSFAIVMWEMIAGGTSNPFLGMAPVKFYKQTISQNVRPPVPSDADAEYVDLLTSCWRSEPSDRPGFDEIVQRLEKILKALGESTELPPTFQGGYHYGPPKGTERS